MSAVVELGVAVAVTVALGVGLAVVLVRERRVQSARVDEARARAAAADRRAAAAERRAQRLAAAAGQLDNGLVVCDDSGEPVWRNECAARVLADPITGALTSATVERLVGHAVAGATVEETVELFGPPRRAVRVVAAPLAEGGRQVGAVAVIEDVSDRRRLEEVRRDFVANISHELKTPVGALGLLAETLAGEDDVAVSRRLAGRMQTEALRVGRIIEDLLDLSRIEAEESPLRDPVSVAAVLAEAVDRLGPTAEHRGVRLALAEPQAGVTVLGDRRQLVSAVHGLVENAVTYSDPGGEVRVRATTDGRTVDIVVADRGIGIPARDLDRIFERFYRVDRARSRETGGTGLGLAIVRHVAGNHGGEVRVQSREGRGSTFTLCLPAGPVGVTAAIEHTDQADQAGEAV